MKRVFWFCVMACVTGGLTACDADSGDPQDVHSQASLHHMGPYTVGVQETVVTYQAPGQDGVREIPVIVWYPSDATGREKDGLTVAGLMPLPTRGFKNLPLAQHDGQGFPLVIHSHGSGGEASLAYPGAEVFASRGWVVASISHTGNTTLDALGDPLDVPMYIPIDRMLDVSRVIDEAEKGFGFEGFEGRINTAQSFMYGHSLGGYTSLAIGGAQFMRDGAKGMVCEGAGEDCEEGDITCGRVNEEACAFLDNDEVVATIDKQFRDERVVAIGLQAPGTVGMIDPSTVQVPALMMTADQDGWLPKEREAIPIWTALHHPSDLWLRFADAGHLTFITMCEDNVLGAKTVSLFLPSIGNDGCNETYMSSATMADINTAYLVAFAEKHVLGVTRWDAYVNGKKTLDVVDDVHMTATTHNESP